MAVTITLYDSFSELIGDGTIDMDGDTFKVILLTNSATFSAAHDELADISANEIANGDGYTTGGLALTSVTWGQTGGTATFDAADAIWTASGSGITAYKGAIYSDTSTGDKLVCFIDFDGVQAAAAGAQFKLIWNASGIFTLAN